MFRGLDLAAVCVCTDERVLRELMISTKIQYANLVQYGSGCNVSVYLCMSALSLIVAKLI